VTWSRLSPSVITGPCPPCPLSPERVTIPTPPTVDPESEEDIFHFLFTPLPCASIPHGLEPRGVLRAFTCHILSISLSSSIPFRLRKDRRDCLGLPQATKRRYEPTGTATVPERKPNRIDRRDSHPSGGDAVASGDGPNPTQSTRRDAWDPLSMRGEGVVPPDPRPPPALHRSHPRVRWCVRETPPLRLPPSPGRPSGPAGAPVLAVEEIAPPPRCFERLWSSAPPLP